MILKVSMQYKIFLKTFIFACKGDNYLMIKYLYSLLIKKLLLIIIIY